MMLPSPWVMVPAASPARRPVNLICGWIDELEALKPRPMLPAWSMAIDPIQRYVESGP